MLKITRALLAALLLQGLPAVHGAAAQKVVKHIKSRHSAAAAIERVARIAACHGLRNLRAPGFVEYAAPAALAAEKGKQLLPARLLVFVDDKAEYADVMESGRLFALEFPFKLLVWEDDKGGVWVSYRSMEAVAGEYQLHAKARALAKLDALVDALGKEAAN